MNLVIGSGLGGAFLGAAMFGSISALTLGIIGCIFGAIAADTRDL